MCIFMFLQTYMYTYICIYIYMKKNYTYVYIHVHEYIYTYVHISIYRCIYIYMVLVPIAVSHGGAAGRRVKKIHVFLVIVHPCVCRCQLWKASQAQHSSQQRAGVCAMPPNLPGSQWRQDRSPACPWAAAAP